MKEKSYAVIGLGQFGMSVAETLAESDCDVLMQFVQMCVSLKFYGLWVCRMWMWQ